MTGRAAVLGRPVAHSLSPVLHRAAYAALGLDWTYEAIECDAAALPGVLSERRDWAGFSCTMPLKHAALDVAGTLAPQAAAVGCANTLLPDAGGWRAANTDVAGIVAALREHGVDAARPPVSATVLGAGGTAQAALAACAELGMTRATVLLRDPARGTAARQTAARVGVEVAIGPLDPDADALRAPLVVSTLPPGAADPLAGRDWVAGQTVLDVAYDPWPSALCAAAARGGAQVVSGALMLLHQAVAQVALMTGRDAPVSDMRAALRAVAPGFGR